MWPFKRRKKNTTPPARLASTAHPAPLDTSTADAALSSFWTWWTSADGGSSRSSSVDSSSAPSSDWGTSSGGDFCSADGGDSGGCGGGCGGGGD